MSRRPGLARTLLSLHQQTALVGLVAIAVHGITLLGDAFLSPSIGDIVIPFTSRHEPLWTGLGVTGGWLAAILGLSYWVRDRIGARLWRKLHRATVLVYVLAVAHTLGAGTDASEPWMRVLLIATTVPIVFLFVMRVLTPASGPRFVRYRVAGVMPESNSVCSFALVPAGRRRIAAHRPGQFVTLRANVPGSGRVLRSYSLSRATDDGRLRISVKREPDGVMSRHLHGALDVGAAVELAGPSGAFVLGDERCRPVVLISAGIGATPVLAMLHELAAQHPHREAWWIHGARNGREHPFRAETRALVGALVNARAHVRYSRPERGDVRGRDFDARAASPWQRCSSWASRSTRSSACAARRRSWPILAPGCETPASRRARSPARASAAAAPPRRSLPPPPPSPDRPCRHVRALERRDAMGRRPREPARAGRGARRPGRVGLPHRRLPRLPRDGARRQRQPRPRAAGAAAARQRAAVLRAPRRRRRARRLMVSLPQDRNLPAGRCPHTAANARARRPRLRPAELDTDSPLRLRAADLQLKPHDVEQLRGEPDDQTIPATPPPMTR